MAEPASQPAAPSSRDDAPFVQPVVPDDDQARIAPASQPVKSDIFDYLAGERLVYVGSGRPTSIRESPGSVWLLDAKDLQQSAAWTLYDSMRRMPGMLVREYGVGHTEANLRFPGTFPENHTLVLIDGRLATTDSVGMFDRQHVNLRDIERVETVYGPSSTLYGANAVSGVISITTRKPSLLGHRLYFSLDGGAGLGNAGDTARYPNVVAPMVGGYGEYSYGWGSGGIKLSVGGWYHGTFGYETDAHLILTDPVRRITGNIDVLQKIQKWELRLQAWGFWKGTPATLFDGFPTQQYEYGAHISLSRERLAGADDKLNINLWAKSFTWQFPAGLPTLQPRDLRWISPAVELKVQYALPSFYGNAMTVGLQMRASFVDAGDQVGEWGKQQYLVGVFVEDTYRPVRPLLITAGLRLDTREGPASRAFQYASFSPRASVVWLINENHTLRVEYSSAFRTPTAVERSAQISSADNVPLLIGDPNIQNEYIHAWSLAWLGRIGPVAPRLEVFLTKTLNNMSPNWERVESENTEFQGKPLAIYPGTGPYKLPFYYYNLPGYLIPGAILKVDYQPTKFWRGFVSYTLFPVRIQHVAGLGETFEFDRFFVGAELYFHGPWLPDEDRFYDVASRLILNAKAGVYVDNAKHWLLTLSLLNAIDARFHIGRELPTGLTQQYWRDASTGERVGPRGWLSLEYRI